MDHNHFQIKELKIRILKEKWKEELGFKKQR